MILAISRFLWAFRFDTRLAAKDCWRQPASHKAITPLIISELVCWVHPSQLNLIYNLKPQKMPTLIQNYQQKKDVKLNPSFPLPAPMPQPSFQLNSKGDRIFFAKRTRKSSSATSRRLRLRFSRRSSSSSAWGRWVGIPRIPQWIQWIMIVPNRP